MMVNSSQLKHIDRNTNFIDYLRKVA